MFSFLYNVGSVTCWLFSSMEIQ